MYRVVIVEDDPMVSLLELHLVERDAQLQVVQSLSDGRAALAWLEQNPADLAVLDVYMPSFTGLESPTPSGARGWYRRHHGHRRQRRPHCGHPARGVVDHLVKPFTYERFQQALDNSSAATDAVAGDAVEQSAL